MYCVINVPFAQFSTWPWKQQSEWAQVSPSEYLSICICQLNPTLYYINRYRSVESKFRCSEPIKNHSYLNLQHQSSRNKYAFKSLPSSSSDKVQVNVLVHSIVAFMLLKQIAEFVHVQLVEGIELLSCWLLILLHLNWPSNCREVKKVQDNTLRVSALYDLWYDQFNIAGGAVNLIEGGIH